MIIRYTLDRLVPFEFKRRQGAGDVGGNCIGTRRAVDPAQQALVVVELDQWLGLLVVGLEPVPDHLRLVVVADDQFAAVYVADPLALRWVELDVEDVAGLDAGATPGKTPDDLVVGSVDQED